MAARNPYEPDPNTEAGRANLELQKKKIICSWCAGGWCYPAWPASCFVRHEDKLRPACKYHADEGDEQFSMEEGVRLYLAEMILNS